MMVFEQQVLYAVDQSHPDPKPTTFCNFLASTQGWNLVQSPEKNSNGRFDRKKYNDLCLLASTGQSSAIGTRYRLGMQ